MRAPKTKILLDGGNPGETLRIKHLLGFLDGQTTNRSLVAKNPDVKISASEHGLSVRQQMAEYRKIVEAISQRIGDAGAGMASALKRLADLDPIFPGPSEDQTQDLAAKLFDGPQNARRCLRG